MKPVSSGYADVNGIKLYHEIYGEGEPLSIACPGQDHAAALACKMRQISADFHLISCLSWARPDGDSHKSHDKSRIFITP